jgi:4-aminobutyrate aminotransferase
MENEDNQIWLERDKAALASVLPRCTDIVAIQGEGSYLIDARGTRFLDFSSGIAANSTGHCHPEVVKAIKRQAETLLHVSVTTHHALNIQLAERLGELCPWWNEPQVFFCNSGAEAVDGALKLARRVTGRSGVVAFQGAFHGRTVAATSLTTAKQKYREGYTPHLPYVYHASYNSNPANLSGLNALMRASSYKVGALIVEPVLGEGGYVVPSKEWLQGLRSICNDNGALLIFDEVQTGIGRTGHWFAAETFGVTPDVILFAKGIASGLPLGGIIAPRSIMDSWPTGTHGSTFGGNPVSCAAALATLAVIEPLLPRIKEKGEEILRRIQLRWSPSMKVRGTGYMIAIELSNKFTAERVQNLCLERGLLVLLCGPEENVIRLIPPLTASDEDWEKALGILDDSLIDGILMYSS